MSGVVVVKESNIEGAGEGLFAADDIPRGYVIAYTGVFARTESLSQAQLDIAYDVGCGLSLVGNGVAAKINDGRDKFASNCKWDLQGEGVFSRLYVICTEDIKKGEELYISYGDGYWLHRDFKSGQIDAATFNKKRIELMEK